MPVDMVKILKTQDENYVRTMRSSNAKVRSFAPDVSSSLKRFFLQKIDRIKSQLSTMADLVHEGGGVNEEELPVLEKSGVLASRKLKGKTKARSRSGPKHVVFVEEGGEGSSHLFYAVLAWRFTSAMLLDTYEGPSSPVPVLRTASGDDESEIDLGWKPEGHQKRKKGKERYQGQDDSNLQLLEEESKVRFPFPSFSILLPIQTWHFRNIDDGWFRSFQLEWSGTNSYGTLSESWRCRSCSWGRAGRRS